MICLSCFSVIFICASYSGPSGPLCLRCNYSHTVRMLLKVARRAPPETRSDTVCDPNPTDIKTQGPDIGPHRVSLRDSDEPVHEHSEDLALHEHRWRRHVQQSPIECLRSRGQCPRTHLGQSRGARGARTRAHCPRGPPHSHQVSHSDHTDTPDVPRPRHWETHRGTQLGPPCIQSYARPSPSCRVQGDPTSRSTPTLPNLPRPSRLQKFPEVSVTNHLKNFRRRETGKVGPLSFYSVQLFC